MPAIRHTIAFRIAAALAIFVLLGSGSQTPQRAFGTPNAASTAAAASARIDAMSANLSATMKSYATASDSLVRTRSAIVANAAKAKTLDASIATGRTRLAAEARFLYRTGGIGFVEVLLGSTTFEEFVNRAAALRRVSSRDAQLVGQLAAERSQRVALRVALRARERQQAALVATIAENRTAAQHALDAQQRYVDSLAPAVTAVLDAQRAQKNFSAPTKPRAAKAGSVVSAKVDGSAGSYAVLAGQPMRYEQTGVQFDGIATWYGNVRPNMSTASGRPFDENQLTCAHKTLPFGTRIAVTFRGRSVIVIVTDRGPYGGGRVIDLSKRAASIIGLTSAGVGQAHCEVVRPVR